MIQRFMVLFVCLVFCLISTPSQSTEISGAWKIGTQGGPVPLCNMVQAGDKLSGWCVGPFATGTLTGAVVGQTVRWRWQWVRRDGKTAAAFDFMGTLRPDDTITGIVERPEIKMSLNFTAKRQFGNSGRSEAATPNAAPQPSSSPAHSQMKQYLNDTFEDAERYYARGPSPEVLAAWRQNNPTNLPNLSDEQIKSRLIPADSRVAMQAGEWLDAPTRIVIPGPPRSRSLREQWDTIEPGEADTGIDPQIEARALKLFPWASQQNERTRYIIDEMNAAADRRWGNSYSIHHY
jgi:hypothetical protein